jgi:signal transduction histidine kinase
MSTGRDTRAGVLIIHANPRIARFFEGVLRGGFRANVVMDCDGALDALRIDPPDLILCDIGCLAADATGFLGTLREEFDFAQIPLIVVTGDHPGQQEEAMRLRFGAVDFIQRSISPRLLKWKVENWLYIKREVDRIRQDEVCAEMETRRVRSLLQQLVHDLKSPLSALRGFLKRLISRLDELSSDSRTRDYVQRLDDISRSMHDILDDGGNPGKNTGRKDETLRLDTLAVQVVRQHQQPIQEKEIDVKIVTGEAPAVAVGSRVDIRRVIDNLLTNAIVHAHEVRDPRIVITIVPNGRSVIMQVSDNGVGIPHKYQHRIFDPFFRIPGTGEEQGRGLGLHIVKELVESHKGRVWVESEPGEGATFAFSLPKPVPRIT